jgi:hypothetical protein
VAGERLNGAGAPACGAKQLKCNGGAAAYDRKRKMVSRCGTREVTEWEISGNGASVA